MSTKQARTYDAVAILDFGRPGRGPLPAAERGDVVIRYGGWSFQELQANTIVRDKKLMCEPDWFNEPPWDTDHWSTRKLRAGIYRLRLPVRNSNRKTFAQQEAQLPSGEQMAPAVLVASALIVHRLQTGKDLLNTDWTRCKDRSSDGNHIALCWDHGWLNVGHYDWNECCLELVCSSSVLVP